jgi:hypothetical protein
MAVVKKNAARLFYSFTACCRFYYMIKIALQGNVDGAEDIELLSSFKNMYQEKKKANKVEKTCGISCWTEFLLRLTTTVKNTEKMVPIANTRTL